MACQDSSSSAQQAHIFTLKTTSWISYANAICEPGMSGVVTADIIIRDSCQRVAIWP